MQTLFEPKSIVVIGVSEKEDNLPRVIAGNLLRFRYPGEGARLLGGLRGEPPADREAIANALVRLSCLLSDFPEITEIDLNPLIVFPQGATLVDGRIVLGM